MGDSNYKEKLSYGPTDEERGLSNRYGSPAKWRDSGPLIAQAGSEKTDKSTVEKKDEKVDPRTLEELELMEPKTGEWYKVRKGYFILYGTNPKDTQGHMALIAGWGKTLPDIWSVLVYEITESTPSHYLETLKTPGITDTRKEKYQVIDVRKPPGYEKMTKPGEPGFKFPELREYSEYGGWLWPGMNCSEYVTRLYYENGIDIDFLHKLGSEPGDFFNWGESTRVTEKSNR